MRGSNPDSGAPTGETGNVPGGMGTTPSAPNTYSIGFDGQTVVHSTATHTVVLKFSPFTTQASTAQHDIKNSNFNNHVQNLTGR